MVTKKKSKEFRLAEIAYALGRQHALGREIDAEENDLIEMGAKMALAKWKEETGGKKKPEPTNIDLARKKWEAEKRPPEGVLFRGARYVFEPDGTFNLEKNFEANLGAEK